MSDHNERACHKCGSLLHHEDDCSCPTRSPLLTAAMERVLRLMVEQEEELVGSGGAWWVGEHRTCWSTVRRLLQLCLISECQYGSGSEIYFSNEEAKALLDNPSYVPLILRAK